MNFLIISPKTYKVVVQTQTLLKQCQHLLCLTNRLNLDCFTMWFKIANELWKFKKICKLFCSVWNSKNKVSASDASELVFAYRAKFSVLCSSIMFPKSLCTYQHFSFISIDNNHLLIFCSLKLCLHLNQNLL